VILSARVVRQRSVVFDRIRAELPPIKHVAATRRERNDNRDTATARRTDRFRSARRNAGYNLIDLARGDGILQVLKTTAHQTAMPARPRFTCPGTASLSNRRAVRDVTRLYRRMSAAHVTQQSRWLGV